MAYRRGNFNEPLSFLRLFNSLKTPPFGYVFLSFNPPQTNHLGFLRKHIKTLETFEKPNPTPHIKKWILEGNENVQGKGSVGGIVSPFLFYFQIPPGGKIR